MIEMGKKYRTRDGRKVRILCTDASSEYSVAGLVCDDEGGESIQSWTADGIFHKSTQFSVWDLVEISPYEDWPIDAPVWVHSSVKWVPRHFAGIDRDGRPLAWNDGGTSHTQRYKSSWDDVRLASEFTPTAEER